MARKQNKTLYSGVGVFDLSNNFACHAVTCARVEGFLICGNPGAYQVSHRCGVLLSGTPFFVFFIAVFLYVNKEHEIFKSKIFWARNPSTISHMITWSHSLQGLNLCMESKTYVVGTST